MEKKFNKRIPELARGGKAPQRLFQTALCDLLGIEYPIIQGALGGGISGPELAAAVSNAGGLGVLAA